MNVFSALLQPVRPGVQAAGPLAQGKRRSPEQKAVGKDDGLRGKAESAASLTKDLESWLQALTRDPLRQAVDLFNGFIRGIGGGKGPRPQVGSPVRPQDITVNAYADQNSFSVIQQNSTYFKEVTSDREISLDITGADYQRLISGMVVRYGSPVLPSGAAQVNVDDVYTVQIGLTVAVSREDGTNTFVAAWQGSIQVVDKITGQGSMGYGWKGGVGGSSKPTKAVADQILNSPVTGFNSQFIQPTTLGTSAQVPQQPVALAYVQNVIGQTPSTAWPMASYAVAGPFDPIPGATTPFVPNSFGIS